MKLMREVAWVRVGRPTDARRAAKALMVAFAAIAAGSCAGPPPPQIVFELEPAPEPGGPATVHLAAIPVLVPTRRPPRSSDSGEVPTIDAVPVNIWKFGADSSAALLVDIALIRVGDTLVFRQTDSGVPHGLEFLNEDLVLRLGETLAEKPDAVLRQVGMENLIDTTVVVAAGDTTVMARFEVIKDLSEDLKEPVRFQCFVHKGQMSGQIGPPVWPALVYVQLHTEEERQLAAAIRDSTRSEADAEPQIRQLRDLLDARFQSRPEPLVLRVAAGTVDGDGSHEPITLTVRLTNLLPSNDEVNAFFGAQPGRWSSTTSLHVNLARYSGAASDGAAIGNNLHSLVVRGDSRKYEWTVDSEFGVAYFRDMADPAHLKYGLFGALVAEPAGSQFVKSMAADTDPPGTQAVIQGTSPDERFREFVIFTHEEWGGPHPALNYQSATGFRDDPPTPRLRVTAGDRVVIRHVHAYGTGNANHSLFVHGHRWPFDIRDPGSNRISAVAEGPSAAYNLMFIADSTVVSERTYLYGCHVSLHLTNGEWGELVVVAPGDSTVTDLGAGNDGR